MSARRSEFTEARALDRIEDVEWGMVSGCAVAGGVGISTVLATGITEEAFTVPAAALAFRALRKLHDGGHPLTEITYAECYESEAVPVRKREEGYWAKRSGQSVASQLFGDGGYWADTDSLTYLASRMVEDWRVRQFRTTLATLMSDAREWQGGAESLITEGVRRLMDCLPEGSSGVVSMRDVLPEVWNGLLDEYDRPGNALRGMSTGFPKLNRITLGLRPGQLTLIGAESGVGKSMLAGEIALNISHDAKQSLIYSLEMDESELVERYLFAEAQVKLDSFADRRLSHAEQQRLETAYAGMIDLPMHFCSDSTVTLAQIISTAKVHKARHGLDLLVVDYAQLVQTRSGVGDENKREREVAAVSRALKTTAGALDCHVILMTQLNDDGRVRESRALLHDASFYFHLREASGDAETAGAVAKDGDGNEVTMKRLICKCGKARGTGGKGKEVRFLQVPGTTRLLEEEDF